MVLSLEEARTIWRYDPETGHFFWLISPRYDVLVGDRAGNFDGKYWRLRFKKKNYKASRVAWLVSHGEWPTHQIDHINGNKLDDRLCNLREATLEENARNRGVRKNNKLGIKGVRSHGGKFVSKVNGIYLGCFDTIEEAKARYDVAATDLHGEFVRT